MKAWQESGLRISRRFQACDHKFIDSQSCLKCGWTPSPSVPKPLPPPAVSLNEAAASGQLCQAQDGGHYWDRVTDHAWKCRRCGALTRSEKP